VLFSEKFCAGDGKQEDYSGSKPNSTLIVFLQHAASSQYAIISAEKQYSLFSVETQFYGIRKCKATLGKPAECVQLH
jgi:hypothetical protein